VAAVRGAVFRHMEIQEASGRLSGIGGRGGDNIQIVGNGLDRSVGSFSKGAVSEAD